MQATVDDILLHGCSNMETWLASVHDELRAVLAARLQTAVVDITGVMKGSARPQRRPHLGSDASQGSVTDAATTDATEAIVLDVNAEALVPLSQLLQAAQRAPGPNTGWQHTRHVVTLRNQLFCVSPPIQQSRTQWITHLHNIIAAVCSLPTLHVSQFGQQDAAPADITAPGFTSPLKGKLDAELSNAADHALLQGDPSRYFVDVLNRLPGDLLERAYATMEDQVSKAQEFALSWVQYQALWNLDATSVETFLGDSLTKWKQLLVDIRETKAQVNIDAKEKAFGPITVHFGKVCVLLEAGL